MLQIRAETVKAAVPAEAALNLLIRLNNKKNKR